MSNPEETYNCFGTNGCVNMLFVKIFPSWSPKNSSQSDQQNEIAINAPITLGPASLARDTRVSPCKQPGNNCCGRCNQPHCERQSENRIRIEVPSQNITRSKSEDPKFLVSPTPVGRDAWRSEIQRKEPKKPSRSWLVNLLQKTPVLQKIELDINSDKEPVQDGERKVDKPYSRPTPTHVENSPRIDAPIWVTHNAPGSAVAVRGRPTMPVIDIK